MGDAALAGPAVHGGLGDVEGGSEGGGTEEIGAGRGGGCDFVGGRGERGGDEVEDVTPAVQGETVEHADDRGVGCDQRGEAGGVSGEESGGLESGERGIGSQGAAKLEAHEGRRVRGDLGPTTDDGLRWRRGVHASTVWGVWPLQTAESVAATCTAFTRSNRPCRQLAPA